MSLAEAEGLEPPNPFQDLPDFKSGALATRQRFQNLADGEGLEPPVELPPRLLSRQVPSPLGHPSVVGIVSRGGGPMPTKQTPQEYKVNTTLGEAVVRPCCTKFDCTTLIVQLVKKTKSGADGGN